jgi:hypothetical protein
MIGLLYKNLFAFKFVLNLFALPQKNYCFVTSKSVVCVFVVVDVVLVNEIQSWPNQPTLLDYSAISPERAGKTFDANVRLIHCECISS